MKKRNLFDEYYPADAGHQWTMEEADLKSKTVVTCTSIHEDSPDNYKVTFKDEFEIDPTFTGGRTYRVRAGEVFDLVGGAEVGPILKLPLEDGKRWSFEDPDQGKMVLSASREEEPVETPMGTFENCFRVEWLREQQGLITVIEWYAKGVGLVKYNEHYVTGIDTYHIVSCNFFDGD